MDRDDQRSAPSADEGGDAACWLGRVRDCCGTLEGEAHRAECAVTEPGARE